MTLIDKILNESEFHSELDTNELKDIKDTVQGVVTDSGAGHVYNVSVVPYGPGFKVVLSPNENFAVNIENGLDLKLINNLGWEKLDSEMDDKGNFILYYR